MAIKKIKITEDKLRLISNLNFQQFEIEKNSSDAHCRWGIDQYSIFGDGFLFEQVALCIGKFDRFIKGTEEDYNGRKYPKELEDYMWSLYCEICDEMEYIESLVHYYISRGGLKIGTYKCKDYEASPCWTYTED